MDLFQLETFLAVAEERSFSRAAARLHRTQPAVSQIVRKLEDEIGEVLLDRAAREGRLTAAGEVLRDYAERLINMRGEATAALAELKELQRGRLSIAANEYTCLSLLPLLDAYQKTAPRVKIAVQRSYASRISDELLSHSVELGVVSFRPEDPQVRSIIVYRDELVCAVHPRHPMAKKKAVSIRELGRETFVAHNVPSPLRQKVEQAFGSHNTRLNMTVQLPSLEAIKRYVAMGNGVALAPALSVKTEIETGRLVSVPVPELQFERKLRLVHRRQAKLSHAAKEFLRVAEQYAAEHGDPYAYTVERVRESREASIAE